MALPMLDWVATAICQYRKEHDGAMPRKVVLTPYAWRAMCEEANQIAERLQWRRGGPLFGVCIEEGPIATDCLLVDHLGRAQIL